MKQTEASAGLAASTSEAHICTPFCKHLLKGALVVETHTGVTSTEMSHRAFDSSLYSALYLPPSLELNFHSCFFFFFPWISDYKKKSFLCFIVLYTLSKTLRCKWLPDDRSCSSRSLFTTGSFTASSSLISIFDLH